MSCRCRYIGTKLTYSRHPLIGRHRRSGGQSHRKAYGGRPLCSAGVSFLVNLLGPKRLELLLELVPTARIISLLVNLGNPNIRADVPETQRAAEVLGRDLEMLPASSDNELDAAFATCRIHTSLFGVISLLH